MRGVFVHAPRDLRIEPVAVVPPGDRQVRVEIGAGGICGSDLHYFHHGGFGTVRLREPMALGHEIAGTVVETGSAVMHVRPGDKVAVNPSLACGSCRYCGSGQRNQCLDMRFMGSAMRFPHAQGGFRQSVTVEGGQAVPLAPSMSLAEGALAEPLAVCLHAARQAGDLVGKAVLVTGSGPIGALCVAVARHAGAAEIVVTDVDDFPLATSRKLGATRTINVSREADTLSGYAAEKGHFDVAFEASGNALALRSAIEAVRAGGTVVQLGLGGEMQLPLNLVVTKELQFRGSFRFDEEFAQAVELMGSGALDVGALITDTLPFTEAESAFLRASDRSRAMKVQLSF
ncbi:L-idonate 5-dehydrogenase [Mesorhizobium sp. L-8-10]|uniref:L-idonate 5-dehydrogenase n=1 Tax=unclassified Mesorhizobium TaxID=325217 RepID=UPI0019296BFA|nr:MULTISPECIES: L-idonate 5-dehydrogenase [unclassified Mesorhizobium]BCH26350.1 L-idonate 5-dehydrogenase [Mesorhizobium sp. L-8-3]BCH34337.1 L-idonate 5-dehydrogenase [Mesorhizobium sp. L-8-10]